MQNFKLPDLQAIANAMGLLNPVVTVAEWPFLGDIQRIDTGDGTATIRGTVTGVRMKWLP